MSGLKRVTAATLDVVQFLRDASEPVWGLLIVKALGRPTGTVYPILDRLESLGWVSSEWETQHEHPGPPRRLYVLTEVGRENWAALQHARAPRDR